MLAATIASGIVSYISQISFSSLSVNGMRGPPAGLPPFGGAGWTFFACHAACVAFLGVYGFAVTVRHTEYAGAGHLNRFVDALWMPPYYSALLIALHCGAPLSGADA